MRMVSKLGVALVAIVLALVALLGTGCPPWNATPIPIPMPEKAASI